MIPPKQTEGLTKDTTMAAAERTVRRREIDLTKGEPWRLILSFYWPLLLTSMLQQFYNFADTWIVGKGLGDNALAAVGNMSSLFFLIIGFSFGLANGFGVLVAQSFGAKKIGELRHRLAGIIVLGALLSVLLTAVSVTFLPYALRLLRTDELIIGDSLRYGYIIFGGISTAICLGCVSVVRMPHAAFSAAFSHPHTFG